MPDKIKPAKALLLAGGYGTRLQPLTNGTPKCLVTVDDHPILDFWINNLINAGIDEAVINTHYLPDIVRKYISEIGKTTHLHISESYEPELLGSAGTITNNPEFADDTDCVVLIYVDNLSNVDLKMLIDFHRQHKEPLTMMLFHAEHPKSCGIATLDNKGRVVEFIEKPQQPQSDLANAGVYVIDRNAYREIVAMNAFDIGYDVLPQFVGRMIGYVFNGYHRDIGTLDSLEQARQDLHNGIFHAPWK